MASVERMTSVEDGIEVGQDNLGMDSVDEETAITREERPGTRTIKTVTEFVYSQDGDNEWCYFI